MGTSRHQSSNQLDRFTRSYLTTAEFVRRAYAAVELLTPEVVRQRPQNGPKELIEEILPLTALLKHLELPSRPVRCRYSKKSAPFDAVLHIGGPEVQNGTVPKKLFVEVTTAVPKVEHLRRAHLNEHGYVFGGPGITVEGSRAKGTRQIRSRAVAVDGDANLSEAIELIASRIQDKRSKTYPDPCLLLVNLEPERPLRITEWSDLIRGVGRTIDWQTFPFRYLYITDWDQGITLPARGG